MKKIFALLLAFFLSTATVLAQGTLPLGFPQDSGGLVDANASVVTITAPSGGTWPNYRLLSPTARFVVTDNGPSGTYVLELQTVGVAKGGTGLTTTPTNGKLLIGNGTGYTLANLTAGSNITITNGAGSIQIDAAGASGAPANLTYITQNNETATLANSSRLVAGSGIGLSNSSNQETIAVDSTVIRTTGAQSMAGPKSLSGGPIVVAAQTDGLVMAGSSFSDTIKITDPAANRALTIPDPLGAAEFVLSAGNSTIGGVKTFSSAPKLATNTLTSSTGNTITLLDAADTLVNLGSSQTLTSKTLTSPIISNSATAMTFQQSGGNYAITAANPGGTRTYNFYDANGNGDIAIKSGTTPAGGAAYGDGNLLKVTAAGTSGQPLISGGASAPAFNTLGAAGGGTGITTVPAKGSLLVGNAGGTAYANLGVGTDGQVITADAASTNGIKWAAVSGTGTVTSVAQSLTSLPFLSISGSPVTTSGTLALAASATTGDLIYGSGSNAYSKLAIGSTNQALIVTGGIPAWGTVAVAGGGTGLTTLTANNVILGNGTSAPTFVAPGTSGNVLTSNGTTWTSAAASGGGTSSLVNGGRIYLTSGAPTGDTTSSGTLYWGPYKHGQIALYDGSTWAVYSPGEKSLSLTLTSGNNYDIFGYVSGGTLALESLIWTNTTTRATALTTQDGVQVKTGATTRRYLGTIYATASNTTADNSGQRCVWNMDNRILRRLYTTYYDGSGASHTYSTATTRAFDNSAVVGSAGAILQGVWGLAEEPIFASINTAFNTDTLVAAYLSIGVDAAGLTFCTTRMGLNISGSQWITSAATYKPALGFHAFYLSETGGGSGTQTWYTAAAESTGLRTNMHMLGNW